MRNLVCVLQLVWNNSFRRDHKGAIYKVYWLAMLFFIDSNNLTQNSERVYFFALIYFCLKNMNIYITF